LIMRRMHILYLWDSVRMIFLPERGSEYGAVPFQQYQQELTKEKKLASIPISVFYKNRIDNKVLRFCFSKDDETLKKAADILNEIG